MTAPVFYRELERQVAQKLPARGTALQFKQAIESWVKQGRIKQDELDWSGIIEWLDGRVSSFRKEELESMLDSEEKLGAYWGNYYTGEPVTDDQEGATLLPGGAPMSICTNCAKRMIEMLGTGEVYGFHSADNPGTIFDDHGEAAADGHDFAVVDDRWIVDPWIRTFSGLRGPGVYDLHDPADAEAIRGLYGHPSKWLQLSTGQFVKPGRVPGGSRQIRREEVSDFLRANEIKVEEVIYGDVARDSQHTRDRQSDLLQELEEIKTRLRPHGEFHVNLDNTEDHGPGIFDHFVFTQPLNGPSIVDVEIAMFPMSADGSYYEMSQAIIDQYGEEVYVLLKRADHVMNELAGIYETGDFEGAKYPTYTLPGGEGYRELLLTLPDKWEQYRLEQNDRYNRLHEFVEGRLGRGRVNLYDARDRGELTADEAAELAAIDASKANNPYPKAFRSAHFQPANIITHVRFKERADADSRRVLFIEELQSDWAQNGRKEGIQTDWEKTLTPEERELREFNARTWRGAEFALSDKEQKRAADLQQRVGVSLQEKAKRGGSGVPRAPLIGKTESWALLAMKRMIRYAAENDFDRIAWTTGEQQAERYDLSKHIERIEWNSARDGDIEYRLILVQTIKHGDFGINVTVNDGGVVTKGPSEMKGRKLTDVLGKDVRDRILDAASGELRELDLKIGGEGMHAFYDQMLPSMVNKYVKKWGSQVSSGTIRVPNKESADNLGAGMHLRSVQTDRGWQVQTLDDGSGLPQGEWINVDDPHPTEKSAGDAMRDIVGGIVQDTVVVHGFELTEAMRESALLYGQPLFHLALDSSTVPATKEEEGYDGLLIRDVPEHDGRVADQWVAFRPEQIEPAIGNRGTFDPSDPSLLYYSRRTEAESASSRPLNYEAIVQIVQELAGPWRNCPPIRIAAHTDDLPDHLADAVRSVGTERQTRGVFDPATGRVYLVATNLKSREQVEETLFHETLGHYGLRRLLGAALLPLLDEVFELRKLECEQIAKLYDLDLRNRRDRLIAAEEVLANLAACNEETGVLSRLFAIIREWARKIGFTIKVNDDDIRATIQKARWYVTRGPHSNEQGRHIVDVAPIARSESANIERGVNEHTDRTLLHVSARLYRMLGRDPEDMAFSSYLRRQGVHRADIAERIVALRDFGSVAPDTLADALVSFLNYLQDEHGVMVVAEADPARESVVMIRRNGMAYDFPFNRDGLITSGGDILANVLQAEFASQGTEYALPGAGDRLTPVAPTTQPAPWS